MTWLARIGIAILVAARLHRSTPPSWQRERKQMADDLTAQRAECARLRRVVTIQAAIVKGALTRVNDLDQAA